MKAIKTLFMSLCICALGSAAMAQQPRVKEIRQLYASALERIKQESEDPHMLSRLEIKAQRTMAAVGLVETTENYYGMQCGDHIGGVINAFQAYFIRAKEDYKEAMCGATSGEFLYDPETCNLIFAFIRESSYEGDPDLYVEQRFYFNEDGSLCTKTGLVKKDSDNSKVTEFVANEESALQWSRQLTNRYNQLLNQEMIVTENRKIHGSTDLTFFGLKGNVKHMTENGQRLDLHFDPWGRLVRMNGADPFRPTGPLRMMRDPENEQSLVDLPWLQRDPRGMICAWSSYESNTEFDVAADGRPLGETSVGEGYAEKVAYTYDAQSRIAKQVTQEVNMDYSTDPVTCTSVGDPITLTFTYSDIDANGNWTIRKDSEGNVTKREIEYY